MFENVEELEKQVKSFQKNILASSELIKEMTALVAAVKAQQQSAQSAGDTIVSEISNCTKTVKNVSEQSIKTLSAENESTLQAAVDAMNKTQQRYVEQLAVLEASIKNSNASAEEKLAISVDSFRDTALKTAETLAAEGKASIHASVDALVKAQESFSTTAVKQTEALADESKVSVQLAVETLNEVQRDHIEKVSALETSINASVKNIEAKYAEFLTRLEAANVDQLFKLCQDMKKSINTKLGLCLAGIGVLAVLNVVLFLLK